VPENLAILNCSQVVTLAGAKRARTGGDLRQLSIIEDGAMFVRGDRIEAVGRRREVESLITGDCEVVEGCETVGPHTLLSFTTETRNIGAGDLIMGDPSTNSLFYWATCHQHYHFEQFAEYNLLDLSNNIVATGHKVGFCLEDVYQWNVSADSTPEYDCDFQGIQAGWSDVYGDSLPGQWIDITDVTPGDYTLEITVNSQQTVVEADYSNNTIRVPVSIP